MKNLQSVLKNPYFKSLAVLILVIGLTLVGYGVAFGYGGGGGGGGGATIPPVVTALGMPLTIGSNQSGTIIENFSDSTVEVKVPNGAVSGQTTFNIEQGALSNDNAPLNSTGAIMVGGYVFNITATNLNNELVHDFSQSLTITIQLDNLPADTTDLGVYYYDENGQWVLVPGAQFDPATGKVTFTVSHLTKFAIFKVTDRPHTLAANVPTSTAQPVETGETVQPQVLGFKIFNQNIFKNGDIIRDPESQKLYLIKESKKVHILVLADFKAYFVGHPVYNVSAAVLAQFASYPIQTYEEKTLLRIPNGDIFEIKSGKKYHIPNPTVLRANYAGWTVLNVDLGAIASYPNY